MEYRRGCVSYLHVWMGTFKSLTCRLFVTLHNSKHFSSFENAQKIDCARYIMVTIMNGNRKTSVLFCSQTLGNFSRGCLSNLKKENDISL